MVKVLVSIIGSKVVYGLDGPKTRKYINAIKSDKPDPFNGCLPIGAITGHWMTETQFERFKNAGKRHPSHSKKTIGTTSRERDDRRDDPDLFKWDVGHYRELVGRVGPWGTGAPTNRDHMTADSSNQMQFRQGNWAGDATSSGEVKKEGLAIAVSGHHHRKASYTYGGRTKKTDTPDGSTRSQFGARDSTASFTTETEEMLKWKSNHTNENGQVKNTLRLEMVGAYVYMYKLAVRRGHIRASFQQDQMLMRYLKMAIANDDGQVRQFS